MAALASALSAALLAAVADQAVKPQGFTETKPATTSPGLVERPALLPDRPAITPEMRGDIYMARKMFREAADTYRQMPADSAITWNKVGIAHHQMLDLDSARRYYEKSIKLNPRYPEAINNLGTVFYSKKNYRKAIATYRRALKINPQSASVLSNLGTAYFARKRYKEALEMYQQALAIDPEVFEHRNAAGVLLQERSVEERAKFHFYLAKTYAKSGNHERAILYLRKALEEGFRERDKLTGDPEFAAMQELPEFQELLKYEPKVL
jgi:tetratricopeptide (TPR) repeat protein